MGMFSEWLDKDKPQGLEGIKDKLSEAYREFGDKAQRRPQRGPQSKPQTTPEPKTDEFAGFDGMDPDKLDALKGLADKQLNPGARAQFVQNALANFQKQQAKPAEEPTPTQAPAPEKKLSLTPNTSLSGGGGTKPPVRATENKPESEQDGDSPLNFDRIGARILGNSVGARKARERLANPRVKELLGKVATGRREYRDRVANTNRDASDLESAKVLLESLGMQLGSNGKFSQPKITDLVTSLVMGTKPSGIPNSRQYSGFFLDQLQSISDSPELKKAMENNDLAGIAKATFRNKFLDENGKDMSWKIASQLYNDFFSNGLQRSMDNFGTPLPPGQGQAFNPLIDVIYDLDDDGNYTGGNNIDSLWQSEDDQDYENYLTHFGDRVTSRRGIANLQKILLTGGMDMNTGLMEDLNTNTGTIDHLFGRSNLNPEGFERMKKESPLNTGTSMGNVNQGKVRTGDDPADLAGYDAGYNDEDGWWADQLTRDIWDRILDHQDSLQNAVAADPDGGGEVGNGLPDNIEAFMAMDGDQIKAISSDFSERSRPNGMDIRNLGKLAPEPRIKSGRERSEIGWLDNSWSGGRGFGYYGGLDKYRAILAGAILKSPELQDVDDNFLESNGITFDDDGNMIQNGKPMSASAIKRLTTSRRAARQNFIGSQYTDEIRGLSTAYGLGRMSNDEYVDHHKRVSDGVMGLIQNPNIKEMFSLVKDETLDNWADSLNGWFDSTRSGKSGNFPIPRTSNALEDGARSATPTAVKALARSKNALEYLTSAEKQMLEKEGFL